jgi:hypothetical protein
LQGAASGGFTGAAAWSRMTWLDMVAASLGAGDAPRCAEKVHV